jgi:hypothetical protein
MISAQTRSALVARENRLPLSDDAPSERNHGFDIADMRCIVHDLMALPLFWPAEPV